MSTKAVVSQEKFNACRDLLAELCIGKNTPGTVVENMSRLLDYLAAHKLQAAGKYKTFPSSLLPELNALMSVPYPHAFKRAQLKSFPCLQALYLLARVTGLMVVSSGKKPVFEVDEGQLQRWQAMSQEARYATLLDVWLTRCDPTILGISNRRNESALTFVVRAFGRVPRARYVGVSPDQEQVTQAVKSILKWCHPFTFGALHLFGLLDLGFDEPDDKGGWQVKSLKINAFGQSFVEVLCQNKVLDWLDSDLDYKTLDATLKHLFPQWGGRLEPTPPAPLKGEYVFRLSSRKKLRVVTASEHTLDVLAHKIIRALEFDIDHLYCFQMVSPVGARFDILDPRCDDGPWANDCTIASLLLRQGDTFTFVYDFGAWHEVTVTLEAIRASS